MLRLLPPFFYALVLAVIASVVLPFDFGALLYVPSNPLDALTAPDFQRLLGSSGVWSAAVESFIAIFLIGTVESVASLKAIDQLDPYKRSSNIGPSLQGIGVSNILSGAVGGLAVIPEVMRSTVGVAVGAKTQWVNLWTSLSLMLGWFLLLPVLLVIPMTVLAAVLIVCAYGLARPQRWKEAWQSGPEGLSVFLTTVLVTLFTDLMWGLIAGSLLHVVLRLVIHNEHFDPTPNE